MINVICLKRAAGQGKKLIAIAPKTGNQINKLSIRKREQGMGNKEGMGNRERGTEQLTQNSKLKIYDHII